MDKTKSKLAAFFDNDDEETSFLSKPVDDAKMSHFTSGVLRKSRREKEQEAADAKKKEEEENAAQAYADFLDEFEGKEVIRRNMGSGFIKADSKVTYIPSMPAADRAKWKAPSPPPTVSAPKPKGKRAMDAFLEEIKKDQADREAKYARHGRSATAMAAYEGQSGSKDRGDPQTTNLFVANLPSHVTEQELGKFFARVGPVGSVKIMWPRSDSTFGPGADLTAARKAKGTGLNGFVSFMTRRDAEDALRSFDGYEWQGSVLRVGWSKAVPIAAKPLYLSTSGPGKSPSRSRSRSRDRRRDHSRDKYHSRRSRSYSRDRYRSRSPHRKRSHSRSGRNRSSSSRYDSRSPQRHHSDETDAVTDTFIRAVAAEVRGQDEKYEEALRGFEKNNPKYNFLLKRAHKRHAFYRGLVESKAPFKPAFDDDGYNSVYSTDSEEESERERTRKNVLGPLARYRFEAMLRAMSGKQGGVARCMAFCLEHAEAAHEVADIIVSSLLVEDTVVPRKVARLHLICDILHNSAAAVPSAWKYRQEFQARLGIVFDHLANIYHSFPGRITADLFKKQITTVVDVWEDWIVFPLDFTSELRRRLEGAVVPSETVITAEPIVQPVETTFSSKFKAATFQLGSPSSTPVGHISDGEPMEVSSDEGKADEDLDGEPVDDIDIDGVPVDDIDGVPIIESAQAEPNHDDLDGELIVDDIDGIPMEDGTDGVAVVELPS